MSYRDDHDAALARIDALEAELGKNVDAKERFATLEQQLATAKAERDRMRTALAEQKGRGRFGRMVGLFACLGVAAVGVVFALSSGTAPRSAEIQPPPPAHVAEAPHYDARTAELMACVKQLDGAVATHLAISSTCLGAIKQQASDPTLGDDIHAVLHDWYEAESRLGTDRTELATRDRLVTRIHDYVIPSYTR